MINSVSAPTVIQAESSCPREQDEASCILIVDDNASFCETLAKAFARRGIKALVAHDEMEALSALQGNASIDRVVLDINLGRPISGLNLIPQLRSVNPQLRIVLLTGYASLATATEAIRLGAIHYLAKPSSVEEVLDAFSRLAGDAAAAMSQQVLSCPQIEWERLSWALVRHRGNISATARFLRMERRTLQRKLQKHARR